MSTTENKAIACRLYAEVWNKRRLEVVPELISASHALSGSLFTDPSVGPAAYKRILTEFVAAFPDLHFTVGDVLGERDQVVVAWTISGTHKREFRGVPGTNRKVSVEGVTIHHIAKGKIIDSDVHMDYFGLMQQLGAIKPVLHPKTAIAT